MLECFIDQQDGLVERPGERAIINALCDGIYACDDDRCITFWSEAAERITGWKSEDVVGTHCYDNVLNHVDKDGHRLCGKEFCPLHRSIKTGQASKEPLLVFGRHADGHRVAMEVSVAPLKNDYGEIIGGVESFRDATGKTQDLEFARKIQQSCMELHIPDNTLLRVRVHYISRDVVGGDHYAMKEVAPGLYGFMLSDVMGHGLSAALYTMLISQLWKRHSGLLHKPALFSETVNRELSEELNKEDAFITSVCGVIDPMDERIRMSGAGGPPSVLMHHDGSYELLNNNGFPLGLLLDATYQEYEVPFRGGDNLLLFSDGVMEIEGANGEMLGLTGFIELLKSMGFPKKPLNEEKLIEALIKYSNRVGLLDDLTILEIAYL